MRGSAGEMCGQQLQRKLGNGVIDLVPVNGDALAMAEVINGTADLACLATANVRATAAQPNASIREIAEVRSSASPNAQSRIAPTGSQGFDIVAPNWLGLYAPAQTTSDVARQLTAALARVQVDPGYAWGGDTNPEGAAADPFAYTQGSLLTPWQGRFNSGGYGVGYSLEPVAK